MFLQENGITQTREKMNLGSRKLEGHVATDGVYVFEGEQSKSHLPTCKSLCSNTAPALADPAFRVPSL